MRCMAKLWIFPVVFTLAQAFAQPQIGGGTCSTASLTGNYATTLTGRQVSTSGTFTGVLQAAGMASFDGQGNVTAALTGNTNNSTAQPLTDSGTVSISSNCSGTMTFPDSTYNLVVYNQGKSALFSGTSGTNTNAGSLTVLPTACLTATLSGVYAFSANGFNFTGTSIVGVSDFTGLLQFDGDGKLVANWSMISGGTPTQVSATGTYAVNTPSSCLGTATLADTKGNAYSLSFGITNSTGAGFQLLASGPQLTFLGSGHNAFMNPSQSVSNGASFKAGLTAPGSIFSIFGENLGEAPGVDASVIPLPPSIGSARVTVNGETAPLFYAGPGQINAQMPIDIAPGLATLVVTSGNAKSNAAAVAIPQAAPGIFIYGTSNHAVVINPSGATNADGVPAHVGDTVVVYFTGGGPVTPAATWTTGAASPDGRSPVTLTNSVTVNGNAAQVMYVGLSGGSVGLYQANFVIPQVAAGDHPLVITVNGVKSNSAAITIAE
jgi:uncharacterized protein (TIGR03437 family)